MHTMSSHKKRVRSDDEDEESQQQRKRIKAAAAIQASDIILSSWGFNSIAPFMNLPELVQVRKASPTAYKLVEAHRKKGILTKRIRAALSRYVPDVDMFISKMKESKAVMSGGFLLHICDQSISYDDIDIYVKATGVWIAGRYHTNDNTTIIDKHIYSLSKQENKERYPDQVNGHYRFSCDSQIRRAKTTLVNNQKFQIVELDPDADIRKVIHDTFDFSVLINTWDGHKLVVNDVQGITERRITLNNIRFEPQSRYEYRVAKYTYKGFTFKDLHRAVMNDLYSRHMYMAMDAYYHGKLSDLKKIDIRRDAIPDDFKSILMVLA